MHPKTTRAVNENTSQLSRRHMARRFSGASRRRVTRRFSGVSRRCVARFFSGASVFQGPVPQRAHNHSLTGHRTATNTLNILNIDSSLARVCVCLGPACRLHAGWQPWLLARARTLSMQAMRTLLPAWLVTASSNSILACKYKVA